MSYGDMLSLALGGLCCSDLARCRRAGLAADGAASG